MNWIDQIAGLFSAVGRGAGARRGRRAGALPHTRHAYASTAGTRDQPAIFLALRARIYPDELEKEN